MKIIKKAVRAKVKKYRELSNKKALKIHYWIQRWWKS